MPILNYDSYSLPAWEGEVPSKEYGAVFAGIENQIINRSDLITTYGSANPDNIIPYGRFVIRQSSVLNVNETSVNVVLPGNGAFTASNCLGVAVGSYTREKSHKSYSNNGAINAQRQLEEGFGLYENVILLRKGLVWVFSETAMAVGATVFVRSTTPTINTNQAFGRIRNVNSGTDVAFSTPQIRVVRPVTVATGGYCLVDIDFTSFTVTA